jgi:2-haloacid dehalogenase
MLMSDKDEETGIYTAMHPLLESLDLRLSKKEVIQRLKTIQDKLQAENPRMLYSDVLAATYDTFALDLAGEAGTESDDSAPQTHTHAASEFASSVDRWPPFPDTIHSLEKLSSLGLCLTILSNVDNSTFSRTRAALEKGFVFDDVFTAEEIGSYK